MDEQEKRKKRKNPGIRKRHMKKRGYKETKWWKECRKLAESLPFEEGRKGQREGGKERAEVGQPKVQWTLGNLADGFSF